MSQVQSPGKILVPAMWAFSSPPILPTVRPRRKLALRFFIALTASLIVPQLSAFAQTSGTSLDLLEESLEPLVPKSKRTEADEDRLLAAAQFTHARMLSQREKYPESLRQYQRAFRHDPSPQIAAEIVRVAGELDRHAEAVRYALLSAEIEPPNPGLCLQLSGILSERGELRRAIRLLAEASKKEPRPRGLTAVLIQIELLRLNLMTEQFKDAVVAADWIRAALLQPESVELSKSDLKKLQPQLDKVQMLVAESYLLTGRLDDAATAFKSVHEIKPDKAMLAFGMARIAAEKKDWVKSREELATYFQERSSAAGLEPYRLLERVIARQIRTDAAAQAAVLAELKKLREHDPKNESLLYFTADRQLNASQLDAAAKLFEEAMQLRPTTAGYRGLAKAYRGKKDAAAVLALLAKGIEAGSSNDVFGDEWKALLADQELIQKIQDFLLGPDAESRRLADPWVDVVGANLALERGELDLARKHYERAIKNGGGDVAKVRDILSFAALMSEANALAVDILEQAIAAKPSQEKLAAYHFYLSGARAFQGETDQALAAAESAAALQSESLRFQSRPAWVLYQAKRLSEARQRYEELIKRFDTKFEPDDVRDELRQCRLILSNVFVLEGRLPEAEELLEQVLDEFPEDAGALNDLGYLWADQSKRLQRALRMVERAVAAESDNHAYRDSLGWAYYRLGRYSEAVRELERAASADDDGVVHDHLGDAYAKMNEREKALSSWKKALELMKDPDEQKQRAAVAAKINQLNESDSNQNAPAKTGS